MDNTQNGGKGNKDRIKSGIKSRRSRGERPRDLHKKSGKSTAFPAVDPKFEMEPIVGTKDAENSPLAASSEDKPAQGSPSSNQSSSAGRSSNGKASDNRKSGDRGAGRASSESARTGGQRRRKLDTSSAYNARGISHEERRRKQNIRDLIKILSAIFAVLILIAAAMLFYHYTLVKTVSISGSGKYSGEQLISISGIRAGGSIFSYDLNELREAVDSVPDVRAKSVKKVFPNSIAIVVEDVAPRAFITGGSGRFTIISADGYVLSITDEPPEGLLEIRGLSGYGFALNTYIDQSSRNIRTVGALRLIEALDKSPLSESVRYIDLSGAAYVNIGLEHNYTVVLGAVTTAPDCLPAAEKAYGRFLPAYPDGGTINVFSGSTIADFTPAQQETEPTPAQQETEPTPVQQEGEPTPAQQETEPAPAQP